ncbi:MAG TPA: alpha/beta hydrolase [Mycobacterium sp.]|uniref:alpha/beta hydrolase n=1 Tax=Mycobacterium sp. TaxID=1785 RepID=UPI002F404016
MPSVGDSASAIDPILQKVLDAVPFRLSADDGVEAARRQLRDLPRRSFHPELRVEDRVIDGPGGPLNIRMYWPPTDDAAPPVVVFFHGGGFVVGDLDTHDGTCRQHAVGASAVVVSVDYRLAPEHPYPAAIEDAWAATQWVAEHGSEIGVDTGRLAVAGDSAGGNISAVITQRSRDEGGPPILFQLLWYPATLWDSSLPSFTENAGAPVLDSAAVATFSRYYAGEIDLSDPPAGMAPGRAANLADLPAAYIAVAGLDPLRDDGMRYGELLAAAGVPVEVHNAEALVHGYVGYAGVVPAATDATDRGLAALRAALH